MQKICRKYAGLVPLELGARQPNFRNWGRCRRLNAKRCHGVTIFSSAFLSHEFEITFTTSTNPKGIWQLPLGWRYAIGEIGNDFLLRRLVLLTSQCGGFCVSRLCLGSVAIVLVAHTRIQLYHHRCIIYLLLLRHIASLLSKFTTHSCQWWWWSHTRQNCSSSSIRQLTSNWPQFRFFRTTKQKWSSSRKFFEPNSPKFCQAFWEPCLWSIIVDVVLLDGYGFRYK